MQRLKLVSNPDITINGTYLHSTMQRLKLVWRYSDRHNCPDLHSTMQRLKRAYALSQKGGKMIYIPLCKD